MSSRRHQGVIKPEYTFGITLACLFMATVLVVEDEPAIQELIAVNLSGAGHRVRTAVDAEQAQREIGPPLPDLILLDWMLPGISGIEWARRLRGDARTRDVPIIMLTARGDESDKAAALETGVDDYITKPFSPRELLVRIRMVLCRRSEHAIEARVLPVSSSFLC